jgi:hypothetical protein
MRQVETSRNIVFDAPGGARSYFKALVVDSLDIGRPDHVQVILRPPPPSLSAFLCEGLT